MTFFESECYNTLLLSHYPAEANDPSEEQQI